MNLSENKAKLRKPLIKQEGVTKSEKYLNSVCENTFLSLWSYPSVYRNQNKKGKGHGKELCDLLVVCGDDVIIFSDKYCEFPSSGNLELDWQRWFKRAIKKSAEQAWGAERWLRSFPNEIYIDRACSQKFPIELPPKDRARYHLIVVANGSEDRCEAYFNGSRSLLINTGIDYNDDNSLMPFMVGDLDSSKTFIHILTKSTLDILLKSVDTITDFVWYLEKKEAFIRKMIAVIVPGEEELLSFYLQNINENKEHDFVIEKNIKIFSLEEGFWEDFINSNMRENNIKANELSYSWDNLIELFSKHILNATQYYTNSPELSDSEKGLRFMAKEPRLVRRMIMEQLYELFENTPPGTKRTKYFLPILPTSPYYVFLCLPKPEGINYEDYRIMRGELLSATMKVTKLKFPDAKDIIGIASEPLGVEVSSEDLIYLDAREWSKEMNEEAMELQKMLNIFNNTTMRKGSAKEFP